YADATYYRSGRGGSHEVQFGTWLQPKLDIEFTTLYVNGGYYLQDEVLRDPNNPAAGTIPFHRTIIDSDRATSTLSHGRDYAFYMQDGWKPSPRLTVNVGVRADFVKRTDRLFDVVVQDSREIGPRVGVNYLVTADGRNSVRANWGIVHDAPSITSGTT